MSIATALSDKGRHTITTTPTTPIAGAAKKMVEFKIGYLVVTDDHGAVKGVLSERDIMRGIAEQGARALGLTAADLMTANPITCAPGDEASAVLREMNLHGFRHMPVVEHGKLHGIISSRDLIRHLLEQTGKEVATLSTLQEMGIY